MITRLHLSSQDRMMLSVEEVESNDGLLISILIWLPPISIFKVRCVSKRWKTIIADRFFLESYNASTRNRQLYYSGERVLALIQQSFCLCDESSHSPMSILPIAQMNHLDIKQIPRKFGNFISSSNGHILCSDGETPFHVVNPLTRTWIKVPRNNFRYTSRFGLAFDENTDDQFITSFRIVGVNLMAQHLEEVNSNTMQIETYCSKTGKWTASSLIGSELFDVIEFEQPYVSNCVFHWPTQNRFLAVYDPGENENHVQLIKLPVCDDMFEFHYDATLPRVITRSSKDDVLWVGIEDWNILKLWKLPKDENGGYKRRATIDANEWVLMHTIATQCLCRDIRYFLRDKKWKEQHDGGTVDDDEVYYFNFEAFTPWNPMEVVLSHKLRVFCYNLESKSIKLLPYRGVPLSEKCSRMHPYVEPLSLSSYALSGDTYDDN